MTWERSNMAAKVRTARTDIEGDLWSTDEVLGSLRRALVGSNRLHASLAVELGLNMTGLSALSHIASTPGITPKQLADLLGITTGSTTGAIDHLAKAGFIRREPHPEDRRSVVIHLTPAGRHAAHWVIERYRAALGQAYTASPGTSPADLASFLDELAEALTMVADAGRASTQPAT